MTQPGAAPCGAGLLFRPKAPDAVPGRCAPVATVVISKERAVPKGYVPFGTARPSI